MKDFFHNNLVHAREKAGLTQEQLAERLGVSRWVIGSLEVGRTNLFNKNIPGIARALEMTEEELLCGVPAETFLLDEMTRSERERALIDDYERRLADLQKQNADLQKEKEEYARLVQMLKDSLNAVNGTLQYMMGQSREEQ